MDYLDALVDFAFLFLEQIPVYFAVQIVLVVQSLLPYFVSEAFD